MGRGGIVVAHCCPSPLASIRAAAGTVCCICHDDSRPTSIPVRSARRLGHFECVRARPSGRKTPHAVVEVEETSPGTQRTSHPRISPVLPRRHSPSLSGVGEEVRFRVQHQVRKSTCCRTQRL